MNILSLKDVTQAHDRIMNHITHTQTITNESLNQELNNKIFFKLENKQVTGSFKVRGAFNHLLHLKEQNKLPKKVVAVSSGNHGVAIAHICKTLGIESLICTSEVTSNFKIEAIKKLNSKIIITPKRSHANELAIQKVKEGYHFVHPSSDDLVIAGQGTVLLETIKQIGEFNSIFAPCGGGGLISGIYLASQKYKIKPNIFAIEPQIANDAQLSIKNNKIFSFKESPKTIADGARTLSIQQNTFEYLKKITAILTANESQIHSWTQKLTKLLQETIEPTSAMAMAGCANWIKENKIKDQKILIIISGGNTAPIK